MPDTLANTNLPENTWVDLYDDTGISVGDQIEVQNIGVADVYLATQAGSPTDIDKRQLLGRGKSSRNQAGDSGAWAFAPSGGGAVNVRLV